MNPRVSCTASGTPNPLVPSNPCARARKSPSSLSSNSRTPALSLSPPPCVCVSFWILVVLKIFRSSNSSVFRIFAICRIFTVFKIFEFFFLELFEFLINLVFSNSRVFKSLINTCEFSRSPPISRILAIFKILEFSRMPAFFSLRIFGLSYLRTLALSDPCVPSNLRGNSRIFKLPHTFVLSNFSHTLASSRFSFFFFTLVPSNLNFRIFRILAAPLARTRLNGGRASDLGVTRRNYNYRN